jgi:FlaA1/EpsC-like NDP-sugar epimerase
MPTMNREAGGSGSVAGRMPRGPVSLLGANRALRYLTILSLDALFTVVSLYLAFLARFDGHIPPDYRRNFAFALPILVAIRLVVNVALGLHRWSFRLSGFHEAVRLAMATLAGSAGFVAIFYLFQRLGPPRLVILLEFFLTSAAMAGLRFSPRLASGWYGDRQRSRQQDSRRTVIVGAGSAGDLLLRDLQRTRMHSYQVVGFVDDDRRKTGTLLGGRPVLGTIDALPDVIEKHDVTQVLIAIPRLSAERIQTILRLCSSLKVRFKIIPVSFTYLNDRITASMLHDLSPEDLLPRDPNVFDAEEVRRLVSSKRILVTGAAGSIGGEIARQVSSYGCQTLVLVDINENNLYFLYRELRERRPDLKVTAEVADVREAGPLLSLGALHRPQVVFHAAAHKHVPLMEDAPAEAVKNNVFGTQNAARMAEACGAERFVLISTDKAVHPASVMGVSKRVAEFVVRDLARTSETRFTAVRFGNVLGSAGSVVPLFKQQIERGGPVTVTHPECRRYFMTIPEAVGLVLLAGLGDYGDLCVLDMGKPIRILDLASHMITMAGLVPGSDIRIEFTGLRPGEKLTEELMTEEEEQGQVVRDRIYAAKSPPPPADLHVHLAELRRQAEACDRAGLLRTLHRLVPTYVSSGVPAAIPTAPDPDWAATPTEFRH